MRVCGLYPVQMEHKIEVVRMEPGGMRSYRLINGGLETS